MKFLQVFCVVLLAVSAMGQYNYQKPAPPATTPRGTYLPPKNEQQEQIAAEGLSPDGEHEPGMPFDFTYAVKDDGGNDFSHNAESDGDVVKGEYRTLLPDGRLQIVKYVADWKNGYNAEVTYEGEAVFPDPPPKAPAPQRAPSQPRPPAPAPPQRAPAPPAARPVQTTKNPYLSDTDIDSQGLTPSRPAPPRQTQPPRRTTTSSPPPPGGLYGAPSVPFGVRNSPKFGYSRK